MSLESRRIGIKALLKAHDDYVGESGSAPGNIGDGYLIHHFTIFRNLRMSVLGLGYRLSLDRPKDYFTFPLGALDHILEKKVLPYRDNVGAFRKIESRYPGVFDLRDLFTLPVEANHITHESTHCLAHAITSRYVDPSLLRNDTRLQITATLLSESFAGATEQLGAQYPKKLLPAFICFMNANCATDPAFQPVVMKLLDRFGFRFTFQLMVWAYLHYNFLYSVLAEDRLKLVLELLPPPGKVDRASFSAMLKVFRRALHMNPSARIVTAGFYFRSRGFRQPIHRLLDFNFLKCVKTNPAILAIMDDYAKALEFGPQSLLYL